jgi:hypothetical protein
MKKSYLSWNKDTVTDEVIFEHLYELSDGKLNLKQSSESLLKTDDLMRTNKRVSNKITPVGQPKIAPNKNVKKGKIFIKNNKK